MNVFTEPPARLPIIFPSHAARLAILRLGTTEIRQKGILFTENERARDFVVILRGEITLTAHGTTFRADASPGDCIGVMSVLIGAYGMHAEHAGIVILRVIPRTALFQLVSENEDVSKCLRSYIGSFGTRATQRITLPQHAQPTPVGR